MQKRLAVPTGHNKLRAGFALKRPLVEGAIKGTARVKPKAPIAKTHLKPRKVKAKTTVFKSAKEVRLRGHALQ